VSQLLHSSPAAGFDEPFEMLHACHGRVQRTLRLLDRLGAHLATHGADRQAREAAADILRYFDIAAPLHHEDEELHVFPVLRASGNAADAALADALHAEHQRMEADWQRLRTELQAVHQGQAPAIQALEQARQRWAAFAALYASHIEAEEAQAYPAARARLPATQTEAMGRDMARRRGVPYPPLTP
jgi:hemerythrin-like domain-containing protein